MGTTNPPVAFINLPYAKRYEKVYLAFVAGLSGHGLTPAAAVRDPSSRVEKLARRIKRADSKDLFDVRPFADLTYAASESAKAYIPSLSTSPRN